MGICSSYELQHVGLCMISYLIFIRADSIRHGNALHFLPPPDPRLRTRKGNGSTQGSAKCEFSISLFGLRVDGINIYYAFFLLNVVRCVYTMFDV